jgi:hypothetical protein
MNERRVLIEAFIHQVIPTPGSTRGRNLLLETTYTRDPSVYAQDDTLLPTKP